jgi:hypothetical protein
MLEGSMKWEARSLYFVAVGVPAHLIYQPAGAVIGGLAALAVIVMVRPRICSFFNIRSFRSLGSI